MTFYGQDLARIHDAGYSSFVRDCAPGILSLLLDAGIESGHVLDLGCGGGVWAAELLARGFRVTGIDISESMIEMARIRAREATFVCGSFHDVDLPPADVVTAIGECFNYVTDSSGSLDALLRRIFEALTPGGLLVFDVALPGRAGQGSVQKFRADSDWVSMSEAREANGELLREITSFVRDGELYRRSHETHRLRIRPRDEVLDALERAGFCEARETAYGELVFPDGYGAFCARRPILGRDSTAVGP